MKYLRLFENYSSLEFPDIFGDSLIRGVKIRKIIGDFYKEYSHIFKQFQNVLEYKPERYDIIRQEALDMLKKWKKNNN